MLGDDTTDGGNLSETPRQPMRIRLLLYHWSSRLGNSLGFFRNPYRYSLVDGSSYRKSYRKNQWQFALITELPFYLGLPLSLSLVHLNPTIALCVSFSLLFLVFIFLYHMLENTLVYARNEPSHSRMLYENPSDHGFNTWELVTLHPDGKGGPTVVGFLLLLDDPNSRANRPTILMLHGNAGNAGHRFPFCRLLVDSTQCNMLIIDYRGFGRSTGIPNEHGFYADARSALEFLHNRTDLATDKLYVFGRSIGGAVAIQLATSNSDLPIRGVMLENTFTSLPAVAHAIFGNSLSSLTKYLLPTYFFINRYPSLERIRTSDAHGRKVFLPHILFLSGEADDLVPPKMMLELYQAYAHTWCGPDPPNVFDPSSFLRNGLHGLVVFPEGKHNCTWLCPNWTDVVSRFIRETIHIPQPNGHQTVV